MRNLQLLIMSLLLIFVLFIGSCSNNDIAEADVEENIDKELSSIYLSYNPMQCVSEPWNDWLEGSEIRFVRAPTQEEIIKMYYFEVYGITISNVEKIVFDGAVCMACYTCPKGHSFEIEILESDSSKMIDLGWKKLE